MDRESSQVTDEFVPGCEAQAWPAVTLSRLAMQGMERDVLEVFSQVPRLGAETGGILVGRALPSGVQVEGFEPVRSEHRFGRLYRLSDKDRRLLAQQLERLRAGAPGARTVVGFYRSQARPGWDLTEEDATLLLGEWFAPDERIMLLIAPKPGLQSHAAVFCWDGAAMQQAAQPARFPFGAGSALQASPPPRPAPVVEAASPSAVERPQKPVPDVATAAPATSRPAAPREAPTPSPIVESDPFSVPPAKPAPAFLSEPTPDRSWVGVALAVFIVAGLVAAYFLQAPTPAVPPSVSRSKSAPSPLDAPAATRPAETADPAPPAQSGANRTLPAGREAADQDESEAIHALLDRWAAALSRGDLDAASACYTTRVAPYLNRGRIGARQVRAQLAAKLGPTGRLDAHRLDQVEIRHVGANRAVATFRRHWQTAGAGTSLRDAAVLMTLVRRQNKWRISSEQETAGR